MITLESWNGSEWIHAGEFNNQHIAWISLGGDNANYRTVDSYGNVLKTVDCNGDVVTDVMLYAEHYTNKLT